MSQRYLCQVLSETFSFSGVHVTSELSASLRKESTATAFRHLQELTLYRRGGVICEIKINPIWQSCLHSRSTHVTHERPELFKVMPKFRAISSRIFDFLFSSQEFVSLSKEHKKFANSLSDHFSVLQGSCGFVATSIFLDFRMSSFPFFLTGLTHSRSHF